MFLIPLKWESKCRRLICRVNAVIFCSNLFENYELQLKGAIYSWWMYLLKKNEKYNYFENFSAAVKRS